MSRISAQHVLPLVCLLVTTGCAAAPGTPDTVSIATWNAEWMIEPATFEALAATCTPREVRVTGETRSIPCDLIGRTQWEETDLVRLRDFVASLPIDVVALQEVDGVATAAVLFPGWSACFTRRKHVQNVGIVAKPGIPMRCNEDYSALGLPENTVRWGVDVSLFPDTPQETRLLGVHLKSGCNRDSLASEREACTVLQRQVPVLEAWIDARAGAGERFAVLGDFNRRFDLETGEGRDDQGRTVSMWPELDDAEPAGADLTHFDTGPGPEPCRRGDPIRQAIDFIVIGESLLPSVVTGSYRMWTYPRDDARWPDHCLRSLTLNLGSTP